MFSQADNTPYLAFIRHLNTRFIIYTDGDTEVVAREGDPANPTTLLTKQQRGAAITSLFNEEKAAMPNALEWLLKSLAAEAIRTESQSLLKAIQSGSADTTDLRRMLSKRAGKTSLLWIPGHHRITGNEEADACAKQAAAVTDGAPRPLSFAAANALIRRTLTDRSPRPLTSWSRPPPQDLRQSA